MCLELDSRLTWRVEVSEIDIGEVIILLLLTSVLVALYLLLLRSVYSLSVALCGCFLRCWMRGGQVEGTQGRRSGGLGV